MNEFSIVLHITKIGGAIMKKLLICLGMFAMSMLNATTNDGASAGPESQQLIECSALDAALQAETEVQAALLDAVNSLSRHMRDTEENLRNISIRTKSPSMTAAARSDMEAAQMRIDELEKCSKDLQTCVNALAASADNNAIQASTVADLNTQVKALESSIETMTATFAQTSSVTDLQMQLKDLECLLNAMAANAAQTPCVTDLQTQLKHFESSLSTMGANAAHISSVADLQTQLRSLESSLNAVAENAAHLSTVSHLQTQFKNLESSVDNIIRNFAQSSDLKHLNMHIGEIEHRLNGTMASFTRSMQALQEKMKIADATMATTNANLMALKKDVRRRM